MPSIVANGNTLDGILFGADTRGNEIRSNRSASNGIYDRADQSTGTGAAGTANSVDRQNRRDIEPGRAVRSSS